MMRKIKHIGAAIVTLFLIGCSNKYQMPPFCHNDDWRLLGNHAQNERTHTDIDFGAGSVMPITNASNGQYDLNFITDDAGFNEYDALCQRYAATLLKRLPMTIDSIGFILADQFLVVHPALDTRWRPDLIRRADGVVLAAQAFPPDGDVQPHDQLWRNFIFDKKMGRIAVVDRLVKNGKHLALIYVLQNENKHVPFAGTFNYDIFSRNNVQFIGMTMEGLLNISVGALETKKVLSYSDYIHTADSCFLTGDYIGASNAFECAFTIDKNTSGQHLYNAACAASLAGLTDLAFERLMRRLALNSDWYVDDPNRDDDLLPLHQDPRWTIYCDSLKNRRERIEANHNRPL